MDAIVRVDYQFQTHTTYTMRIVTTLKQSAIYELFLGNLELHAPTFHGLLTAWTEKHEQCSKG